MHYLPRELIIGKSSSKSKRSTKAAIIPQAKGITFLTCIHAIHFIKSRTINVVQLVFKVRLITGTRDLTSAGNVLHFVTVAPTEWHIGVDSISILCLNTFRICQMAYYGIPDSVTSVSAV